MTFAVIGRLSTHVLDTSLGRPAGRIPAVLEHVGPEGTSVEVGRGITDLDGRIQQLRHVWSPMSLLQQVALLTTDYGADKLLEYLTENVLPAPRADTAPT